VEALFKAPNDKREFRFSFDDLMKPGEEIVYIPQPTLDADLSSHGQPTTDGRSVFWQLSGGVADESYPIAVLVWCMDSDRNLGPMYERTWDLVVREV